MALYLNVLRVTTFNLSLEHFLIILMKPIDRYTKIIDAAFIIIVEIVRYS